MKLKAMLQNKLDFKRFFCIEEIVADLLSIICAALIIQSTNHVICGVVFFMLIEITRAIWRSNIKKEE